jgi:hypothetical protein
MSPTGPTIPQSQEAGDPQVKHLEKITEYAAWSFRVSGIGSDAQGRQAVRSGGYYPPRCAVSHFADRPICVAMTGALEGMWHAQVFISKLE